MAKRAQANPRNIELFLTTRKAKHARSIAVCTLHRKTLCRFLNFHKNPRVSIHIYPRKRLEDEARQEESLLFLLPYPSLCNFMLASMASPLSSSTIVSHRFFFLKPSPLNRRSLFIKPINQTNSGDFRLRLQSTSNKIGTKVGFKFLINACNAQD